MDNDKIQASGIWLLKTPGLQFKNLTKIIEINQIKNVETNIPVPFFISNFFWTKQVFKTHINLNILFNSNWGLYHYVKHISCQPKSDRKLDSTFETNFE